MNTIKKLYVGFLALAAAFQVLAVDKVISKAYVAATATNILSGGKYLVKDILLISTTTNSTTVKFYDSTGATNYVISAYTNYTSYATNFSTTHTNAMGIIVTNTYSGTFTGPTAVGASTNELPAVIGPHIITASGTRTLDSVNVTPVQGLTIYGTGAGTVEVVYEQLTP